MIDQGPWLLTWRSLVYVFLAIFLVFSQGLLDLRGDPIGQALLPLVLMAGAHLVMTFVRAPISFLYPLFLADLGVAATLVRLSGASSSPLVFLFALAVLGSSVVFDLRRSIVSVILALLVMSFSIGFSVSIWGQAAAILGVGALGVYLRRSLSLTGLQLQSAESARRKLENLQRAILANLPSGLMSIDSEGRIIQINHLGATLLGFDDATLIGRPLRDLVPSLDTEIRKLNTLVPAVEAGILSQDRPTVEYLRGDKKLFLGYAASRLTDADTGLLLGTLVIFQDLTRVLELEDTVRRSEKLAAVGKLSASIAHEIRNPLASISGSAQLLGQDAKLSEDDAHLVSIIQRESVRLDGLIQDFLEYVRTPKIKVAPQSLDGLIAALCDSLKVNGSWKKLDCQIETENLQQLMVLGDGDKITQVLMNLVFNAAQAGAKKVRLHIEAKNNLVILDVLDNGAGISADSQTRLFEPFFTTKEQGTGLGLAISYRLLESMGAKIFVQSPVPEFCAKGGTLFRIEFKGVST